MLGIGHSGKPKVAYLEVAVAVEQDVRWLQVTMDHVGRVDVLESSEYLAVVVRGAWYVVRGGGERA